MSLSITNVNSFDSDTIYIKSYQKNSDFTSIIDSSLIVLTDSNIIDQYYVEFNSDTAYIIGKLQYGHVIDYERDWRIKTKNNTYNIENITIKKEKGCCGGLLSLECKKDCISRIVSFKLNGIINQIDYSYYTLFLEN
jgi:hypothetical protein